MSLKSTLTLLLTLSLSSAATWASQLKLWYDAPASEWVEALPLGNSRLGMMVYGSPAHEEIQLNEETLWGGSPHTNHSARALKALPEVRRLVFAGRNAEAQALIDTTFLTGVNGMPYQTVGSLRLNFPGHENATAYYRDLDLDSALTTVTYTVGNVDYRREAFSSFTDDVSIIRLTASAPDALTFSASFTSPMARYEVSRKGKTLILTTYGGDHEGIKGAVKAETRLEIVPQGGRLTAAGDSLTLTGASAATLYISTATNFVNYKDLSANPSRRAASLLATARKKPYDRARREHIDRYRTQFARMSLSLGDTDKETLAMPTDKRIRQLPTRLTLNWPPSCSSMAAICSSRHLSRADRPPISRAYGMTNPTLRGTANTPSTSTPR